jgi:hypothetical protein
MRLWLSAIACNLGNLWRRLVLPKKVDNWSLKRFTAAVGEDRREAGKARKVLRAVPGGRTSEPAAIQRDAGPDRSTAGTGGIADAGQVRIGIGLPSC